MERKPTGLVGSEITPSRCRDHGRGSLTHVARSRPSRTSAGRISPIWPWRTASARPSISVGPPLTITTARPCAFARGTQLAAGYTLSVEPTASSRSHSLADLHRPVDHLGHQRLAERDRVALEDRRRTPGTAGPPRRRGPGPASRPSAGGRRQSQQRVHHIVPWTSTTSSGSVPGLLVQPVDVLGDDGVQLALALELDDRPVAGVRLGVPRRRLEAAVPRRPAHVGVGEVVLRASPSSRRAGFFVHTPFGPRKSGMPESVEMPAPVSTVIRSASATHSAALGSRRSASTSIPRVSRGVSHSAGSRHPGQVPTSLRPDLPAREVLRPLRPFHPTPSRRSNRCHGRPRRPVGRSGRRPPRPRPPLRLRRAVLARRARPDGHVAAAPPRRRLRPPARRLRARRAGHRPRPRASARKGSASPFAKAVQRCVMFGLVQRHSDGWLVRRRIPPSRSATSVRLPDDAAGAPTPSWTHDDDPPRRPRRGRTPWPRRCSPRRRPGLLEPQLVAVGVPAPAAAEACCELVLRATASASP